MSRWDYWLVICGGGGLTELSHFDCCGRCDLCFLSERLSSFSHDERDSGNKDQVGGYCCQLKAVCR